MSNFEYDEEYRTPEEIRKAENRATCSCTLLKCPNCDRSHDNLVTEYKLRDSLKNAIIQFYENEFRKMGIDVLSIHTLQETGVIDILIEGKLKTYKNAKKCGTLKNTGSFIVFSSRE